MAREHIMDVFRQNRAKLLADPANEGLYALVDEEQIAGLYPTFEAALAVGYETHGLKPFLVQQVVQHEMPKYFSRALNRSS